MGETCCCCCKLKTGILIIFILDVISCISYIINLAIVANLKANWDNVEQIIGDALLENNYDPSSDMSIFEILDLAEVAIDLMLAIPCIQICLVFLPRLFSFIYLKMNIKDY